jgi:NADPH:quinone reductase-like Zn-dependent oxidoreductase
MKAVRIHSYGHSEKLRLEETPRPEIKSDEVLVKIRDAGVNPVDWQIREGYLKELMPSTLPLVVGQDVAGEIAEIGASVRDLKPGEEVFGFCRGSYAEYAAAQPRQLARKPHSVDFEAAASIPTAGLTAWQAIMEHARVSSGQRVLIHGAAGGVGTFAVQFARLQGARVAATASARDAAALKEMGVDPVIDYRTQRFEKRVRDADAVIDLVGGDTLARSYQVVKKGGVLVTTLGPIDEAKAKGHGIRAIAMRMRPDGAGLAEIARLIDAGKVKPRLDTVLALSEARKAQDLSQKGKAHGKIVLRVG